MGKYIAGPSVLRFPGRPAIVPGQVFEHEFDEVDYETLALASGAIALQPGETSLADQRAAAQRVAAAKLAERAASAVPAPPVVEPTAIATTDDDNRSVPATRRRSPAKERE